MSLLDRPPRHERIGDGVIDTLWDWLPDILIGLVFLNASGVFAAVVLGNAEAGKDFLIGMAGAGAMLLALAIWEEWPLW